MTDTTTAHSARSSWLQPLATGVGITRRLIQHPTALATAGTLFRSDVAAEAGGPWWNERAIRYLGSCVRRGDRVFEWGSGGSTVWLVGQGARVTSVEHDPQWVAKVEGHCPEADVRTIRGTATGTLATEWPALTDEGNRYFDDYVAAIDEFADENFDVVIVDGMCRAACLRRGAPKVRPGGVIVLDDSDMGRYQGLKKSLPGWKRISRAGFKPTGDLRETTFFHRPG